MSQPIIEVENLSKRYQLGAIGATTVRDTLQHAWQRLRGRAPEVKTGEFWALRDVSFTVQPGEVLGVIGRNGAGKSTLLKILSRITEPTSGRAILRGRVSSLLEVGTGFHPELSGRDNIFLNGAILGMTQAEIRRKFDEIVAFAEVEKFLDTPVKRYSSGMHVRLAFAVAAHLDPEILIVDEVLAVGDAAFQKKCIGKMNSVARDYGRTVLFVSHNLQHVRQFCSRALVLNAGKILYDGSVHSGLVRYHQTLEAPEVVTIGTSNNRIKAVRFVDETGKPVEEFARTGEVRFMIDLEISLEIRQPIVAMAVLHGDKQPVFSEKWESLSPFLPGKYRLLGSFHASYLKCEPYFLTIYLFDNEVVLDSYEGNDLPEIIDKAADPIIESRRWGLVRIPVNWQIKEMYDNPAS